MLTESQIRTLLEDIRNVYETGLVRDDLDTEVEKWSQIQILELILDD
jgi:hypothetical protein